MPIRCHPRYRDIDFICLVDFMRLLTTEFVQATEPVPQEATTDSIAAAVLAQGRLVIEGQRVRID